MLERSKYCSNKSNISKYANKAKKSGKNAIKNTKKAVSSRQYVFRLIAVYNWLIGKQTKAVRWWERAIEESEHLSARPDLARTYMEIGKRFLEKNSNYKELNGIKAWEYLEIARKMFQEMDLQYDLDELDKINVTS